MEFHKPKPVRSWREFLKEYAIIVLGVATALAAEQAVEWAHWRSQVADARRALQAEMAEIDGFYAYRMAIGPCVERRLNQLEQQIAEVAKTHKTISVDLSSRGLGALISDSEWQSEKSAQTLTHFPRDELALMGKFYALLPDMREWETKQADALWGLTVLQNGADIGPEDLPQLRLNLQIARHHEFLIEAEGRRHLALSERLGIPRAKPDPVRVEKFCTLNDADYARYLKTAEPR